MSPGDVPPPPRWPGQLDDAAPCVWCGLPRGEHLEGRWCPDAQFDGAEFEPPDDLA